jgi:hypothetical protein
MLWNQFSRRFSDDDVSWERAHGDGIEVSTNSPEAFEEMIWKHFWPQHYRSDRILPWDSSDQNPEFEEFFASHMRNVIALRRDNLSSELRYVSKNNLNIARPKASPPSLQRGTVLIPFRDPVQQAASMLRQHRRFLSIHAQDDFVRQYMEAIGHHEFGRGLRPVDFGDWLDRAPDSESLAFWVRYWIVAYRFVLEHTGSGDIIVSYSHLTEEPEEALKRLADAVDIPESDLLPQADRLHPPRSHEVAQTLADPLRQEARNVFDQLREEARV